MTNDTKKNDTINKGAKPPWLILQFLGVWLKFWRRGSIPESHGEEETGEEEKIAQIELHINDQGTLTPTLEVIEVILFSSVGRRTI